MVENTATRKVVVLKIGDSAPSFRASTAGHQNISLEDFRGRKVVLYFYPRDNTPGCTKEACDFRDASARFQNMGITVLGVSPDSAESHQKFQRKYSLPFLLISDEDHCIANAYGVWQEKSLYGKKFMGIVRSTFVIDKKGEIAAIYKKVKVTGHVESLLESV